MVVVEFSRKICYFRIEFSCYLFWSRGLGEDHVFQNLKISIGDLEGGILHIPLRWIHTSPQLSAKAISSVPWNHPENYTSNTILHAICTYPQIFFSFEIWHISFNLICFTLLNVGTFETTPNFGLGGVFMWCKWFGNESRYLPPPSGWKTRRWHHRYGRIRSTLGTSSTAGQPWGISTAVLFFFGGGFSWAVLKTLVGCLI